MISAPRLIPERKAACNVDKRGWGSGGLVARVEEEAMKTDPKQVSPRLVVAALWITSMIISWACGALLIGFDSGTTLIWLMLTLLGPLLVWGFATVARGPAPAETRRR